MKGLNPAALQINLLQASFWGRGTWKSLCCVSVAFLVHTHCSLCNFPFSRARISGPRNFPCCPFTGFSSAGLCWHVTQDWLLQPTLSLPLKGIVWLLHKCCHWLNWIWPTQRLEGWFNAWEYFINTASESDSFSDLLMTMNNFSECFFMPVISLLKWIEHIYTHVLSSY